MNTLGEFEISPKSIVLGLVGAIIGFFTASGGFSGWSTGTGPGLGMKMIIAAGGFLLGFVWGGMMGD